jgi:hypothetical protein
MQVQHGMSGCLGVSQRQHFVCAQRLRFCVDWGVVLVAADSTAQVLLCLPMYVLHQRSELQLSPGGLAMLFKGDILQFSAKDTWPVSCRCFSSIEVTCLAYACATCKRNAADLRLASAAFECRRPIQQTTAAATCLAAQQVQLMPLATTTAFPAG